jgi:hypothetical protein
VFEFYVCDLLRANDVVFDSFDAVISSAVSELANYGQMNMQSIANMCASSRARAVKARCALPRPLTGHGRGTVRDPVSQIQQRPALGLPLGFKPKLSQSLACPSANIS